MTDKDKKEERTIKQEFCNLSAKTAGKALKTLYTAGVASDASLSMYAATVTGGSAEMAAVAAESQKKADSIGPVVRREVQAMDAMCNKASPTDLVPGLIAEGAKVAFGSIKAGIDIIKPKQ